ncbi:BQ5605_C010g06206 [Microbotryum silenes-dioicae]|uniref:BQ5605_C010g06206 protein n=1 Tax=Microbotryum silenes-dioicae TaxID=796604 RepID=A0A2X0NUU0_9BASI|nr:BQ5605_C010g06206 [Microbotryum silenes-dioicae]
MAEQGAEKPVRQAQKGAGSVRTKRKNTCGCWQDGTASGETWAGSATSIEKAGTPGGGLGLRCAWVGIVTRDMTVAGCRTLGLLWPDKRTRRGHERNVKRRDTG